MAVARDATLGLYGSRTSTATQRVLLLNAEKSIGRGIDVQIDVAKQDHLTPAYLALNPFGTVPTLVTEQRIFTDSLSILEHLNHAYSSHPNLVPSSAPAKAAMRSWMQQIAADESVRVLSFQERFVPRFAAMEPEAFAAIVASHPTRADWYQEMGQTGFSGAALVRAESALAQLLQMADSALQESAWLAGDTISLADLVLLPSVERAVLLGFKTLVDANNALVRWRTQMQVRHSYQAVFG